MYYQSRAEYILFLETFCGLSVCHVIDLDVDVDLDLEVDVDQSITKIYKVL